MLDPAVPVRAILTMPSGDYLNSTIGRGPGTVLVTAALVGAALAFITGLGRMPDLWSDDSPPSRGRKIRKEALAMVTGAIVVVFLALGWIGVVLAGHSQGARILTGDSLRDVERAYGLNHGDLDWLNHTRLWSNVGDTLVRPPAGTQVFGDLALDADQWGVLVELEPFESDSIVLGDPVKDVITGVRLVSTRDGVMTDLRAAHQPGATRAPTAHSLENSP